MYKKICILTCLLSTTVLAETTLNASGVTPSKAKIKNNPVVANSRHAGSQQTFGEPTLTAKKDTTYDTKKEYKLNKPLVANSRQAGSQQTFGEPPITGTKGQHYHHGQKNQNPPALGSKQASDFVFKQDKNPLADQTK